MSNKPNIAFIVSRIPYPLEKGDKLRAYHQIVQLSKLANIHLFCLSDSNYSHSQISELQKYCASVNVYKLNKLKIGFRLIFAYFSRKPFQVHYFFDKAVSRKIKNKIDQLKPDHIYCQLVRTAEYVKNFFNYNKTIDYMDAFSMGMKRRVANENFFAKIFVRYEANRLTAYESIIFDYFDNHTIISEQDRDLIYHKKQKEIEIIANGVEQSYLAYFKKSEIKYDILFHGNLNYAPNVDCVKYITQVILPLLKKVKPEIRIAISGANPSKKIIEYCKNNSANIILLGYVDNVAEVYKSAKVFFAPLQIGTGLQNKILEAMALKIPVVTSELCNNAIGAKHDVTIITANNPDDYVIELLDLLNNENKRDIIVTNAYSFVKENFSWEKSTLKLFELMFK